MGQQYLSLFIATNLTSSLFTSFGIVSRYHFRSLTDARFYRNSLLAYPRDIYHYSGRYARGRTLRSYHKKSSMSDTKRKGLTFDL
jgi:hypothetical protein